MASWMVHLRVADKLLDRLEGVTQTEFVVGNIAPDSGLPNADWTAYTPDSSLTHFKIKTDGDKDSLATGKRINLQAFLDQYFTKELRQGYTVEKDSFFWGICRIC